MSFDSIGRTSKYEFGQQLIPCTGWSNKKRSDTDMNCVNISTLCSSEQETVQVVAATKHSFTKFSAVIQKSRLY